MDRLGAASGVIGVIGNIAGVAVLGNLPSSYKPGAMRPWVREVLEHPDAAAISGVAFSIGLIGLAGWAVALGRRVEDPRARLGMGLIAAGALINAAGTTAPVVLAKHVAPACESAAACEPAGIALLGTSLALDSLFNLMLGGGLILTGVAMRSQPRWRRLAPLAITAGAASTVVSGQVVSDTAAKLLTVAGPLWLAFVAWTSYRLARRTA
jgi:hypothetical protein